MQCPQRLRLERKHQEASATYASAAQKLRERVAVCPKEEYMRLSASVEAAWTALEQVLGELDRHVEEHCCMAQRSRPAY